MERSFKTMFFLRARFHGNTFGTNCEKGNHNVRFTEDSFYAQQCVLPVEKKNKKAITLLFPLPFFFFFFLFPLFFSLAGGIIQMSSARRQSRDGIKQGSVFLVLDLTTTKLNKRYFSPNDQYLNVKSGKARIFGL